MERVITVEIWSDIMCPFCYIGKRRFEAGLAGFEHRDKVKVVWRSFLLNPDLPAEQGQDVYDYVAALKGQTREWSIGIHRDLVETARSLGLDYRFDRAKIANTFDAHRVIQFARTKGMEEQVEERFFRAYFTEGALISDRVTLLRLGEEAGLDRGELEQVLTQDLFREEVWNDVREAQQLGCRGVPFYVINRKRAVSGAQDAGVFLDVLRKAYAEGIGLYLQSQPGQTQGGSCSPDEDCHAAGN